MIVPLYPFSLLYKSITQGRNLLYDKGYMRSVGFDRMLICVGNLSVGGTGKTPMVEYLLRLLQPHHPVATLSRGYGRKTTGYRLAGPQDNASTLGDEPYQYYRKWNSLVPVAVGEDRALAITNLLSEKPDVDVILLDDAYQHRRVRADLNLLLTTYKQPFWKDHLLPAGRLRESREGAKRAHLLVITKCPENLSLADQQQMKASAQAYLAAGTPVYFSTIRYDDPQPLLPTDNVPVVAANRTSSTDSKPAALMISGLANAQPLEDWVKTRYRLLEHQQYSDHHRFSAANLERLRKTYEEHKIQNPLIITSEKDAVRLLEPALAHHLTGLPLYYIPIRQRFLGTDARDFDALIVKSITEKLGDRT